MLYTDAQKTQSRAFGVASDVNVILIQATTNGQYDIIEEYTGVDGLADAIDDMYTNFNGELAAVIEDGRATSIIIHNTDPKPINAGTTTPSGNGGSVITNTMSRAGYVGSEVYGNGDTLTGYEKLNIMADQIRKDGYDVKSISSTQLTWVDANGTDRILNASEVFQVYKVTVDEQFTANWAGATVEIDNEYIRSSGETVTFKITYPGTPVSSDSATRTFAISYTTNGATSASSLTATSMTNNVVTLTDTPSISDDIHYVFTANPT